jgi:hypothetical protein
VTEARGNLAESGLNQVDFAVPVIFLSDPDCLQVDTDAVKRRIAQTPLDLSGVSTVKNFVGRNAALRTLQTNLDPDQGSWRAAIVHGMGGMGKTVLAARLAQRMAPRMDGVSSMRMTPTTSAQNVLDHLAAFLLVNNARFDHPAIQPFNQANSQPLPLLTKAELLAGILRDLRLLIIFDNCEDILPEAQAVSRAAQNVRPDSPETPSPVPPAPTATIDPDLRTLIALLVEGVSAPSRFLFTSRKDFNPLDPGRLTPEIGHLDLGEMGFREAVYLKETLSPLDQLPIAVIPSSSGHPQPAPAALTLRELHARLGGHPYTLNLFAEHARRSDPASVLDELTDVRQELLEFTLLENAINRLPERAAQLLRRTAIFDEPVPIEGLAFMLGDEQDAMPPVHDEVQALLSWGLLAQPPGEETFSVHSLVQTRKRYSGKWYS